MTLFPRTLLRRTFLQGLAGAAFATLPGAAARAQPAPAASIPEDHPLQAAWQAWRSSYIAPEGRVVDSFQQGASHSEGQGYGMALALSFGDAETFRRLYSWTESNLALRPDALLAWRWLPDALPHVADRNNASDGDLFYAWALARAARLFGEPDYAARARAIAADLVATCVVSMPDGSAEVMLPAAAGFLTETGFILNPSYWMPRAMRDLAAATDQPALARCADGAERLMSQLAANGLVPDWIEVTANGITLPPARFSANSGYEALRVPLFLVWSRATTHPAVRGFTEAHRAADTGDLRAPTVFERGTGRVLEYSTHPGYRAVSALTACAGAQSAGSAIPPFDTAQPYYPATLHLMTLVAQIEGYPRCVPL